MCGITGMVGSSLKQDAAGIALESIEWNQHRGQETVGICYGCKNVHHIECRKKTGLVAHAFEQDEVSGDIAIAHVRYSTSGSGGIQNAQPFGYGKLYVVHNGNIVNSDEMLNNLIDARFFTGNNLARDIDIGYHLDLIYRNLKQGEHSPSYEKDRFERGMSTFELARCFSSRLRDLMIPNISDSKILLYTAAHNLSKMQKPDLEEAIKQTLRQAVGTYSIAFMTPDKIIVARDPYGNRPLWLATLGRSTAFSSETVPLERWNPSELFELPRGHYMVLSKDGRSEAKPIFENVDAIPRAHCIFELIYFMRPESVWNNMDAQTFRETLGAMQAHEDTSFRKGVVVPILSSGKHAALGFFKELLRQGADADYDEILIRNQYSMRTFIDPDQFKRVLDLPKKHNPNRRRAKGKDAFLDDDSIVRSNTIKQIVASLRSAEVNSVHGRISSPPYKWPCMYGIDTPTIAELIAHDKTVDEIQEKVGLDSLKYLSMKGLREAVRLMGDNPDHYCYACFTGEYPIGPEHVKARLAKQM